MHSIHIKPEKAYVITDSSGNSIIASSTGNLSRAVVTLIHNGKVSYGDGNVIEQIRAFRTDLKNDGIIAAEKLHGITVQEAGVYTRKR